MGTLSEIGAVVASPGQQIYSMQVLALLSALVSSALCLPAAEPQLYGAVHGYHHVPTPCKYSLETATKNLCRLEPEKVCETKTQTYTKITGYEKGDCKEIEVCKAPVWRKRRSAEPSADAYGYGYHVVPKCEKETKEICKSVPTTEEVSKDLEWCYYKPKKVCEDVEVKVPKVDCSRGEEEAGSGEAVETE